MRAFVCIPYPMKHSTPLSHVYNLCERLPSTYDYRDTRDMFATVKQAR